MYRLNATYFYNSYIFQLKVFIGLYISNKYKFHRYIVVWKLVSLVANVLPLAHRF